MHSSYALSSDDFSVERNGQTQPMAEFWPGGYQAGVDRLGVVLANPMDPIGCSNLIGGTNTLFYDGLRDQFGQGGFFRYADTYLFGVGCEPGDWNQLDVWPLHKFITILQPTAEAVLEALNDRRITLLAIPETGARCRGEVVLSTWNAYLSTVRTVVLYNPRTGLARDPDVEIVGNRVVESYVEQAIFTTPGLSAGEQARFRRVRRNLDRALLQPVESFRTLRGPAEARALLGITEVLPPGHQELSRRATPTVIMPVEVALPPLDAFFAPTDLGAVPAGPVADLTEGSTPPSRSAPDPGVPLAPPPPPLPVAPPPMMGPTPTSDVLLSTSFDGIQRRAGGTFAEWEGWNWIADFGDPIGEHHAVREAVGVWDESPLRKWAFEGRDALRAADYCFTSDMAALEVGQVRYGAFCDERGKMIGDGTVYRGEDPNWIFVVTALDTDGQHFRRICAARGFDVEIREQTFEWPHLQVQGPRSRELLSALTNADVASLRYFRFIPRQVAVAGVEGCWISRTGYSGELGYEVVLSAGRRRTGLAWADGPGRSARRQAVRSHRRRVATHRSRPDLHRLRLLPRSHLSLPHEPRAVGQARQAGVLRAGRAACRVRRRNHASHGHAGARRRAGAGVRRPGLAAGTRCRQAAFAVRRSFADG